MADNKDKNHDKFVGVKPVSQTIDLIYYEGPLVQATVVKDNDGGPFRLQLDYYAGEGEEDLRDQYGYVGVRWTKEDLQRMINMLDITEGIFDEQKQRQQQQNTDRSNSGKQGTSSTDSNDGK